jgi:hypothetical protein
MTALLHLVSEQTMQNLLPILALRPQIVVQVRSRDQRFHRAVENLKNAVTSLRETPRYGDLHPEFHDVVIEADSPEPEQTAGIIRKQLARYPQAVLNITGGTKLMSLGAWMAAGNQHPVLYCDTSERRFVQVGDNSLPELPRFDQIAATLTVGAVMAAHGVARDNWRFDQPTDKLLEVGKAGFACHKADETAFRDFGNNVRQHFREKGRIPGAHGELCALVQRPLPAAPPSLSPFLDAVADAGLLAKRAGAFYPTVEPRRDQVEQLANLLGGSWLELYVVGLLLRHPQRWSDPRWSVEPRRPAEAVFGETDVICVNVASAALHIISCKTTLRQPLETLEALAQRRRDLGGLFAKATLAVLTIQNNERQKLANWAGLLGVELLVGDEITQAFSP